MAETQTPRVKLQGTGKVRDMETQPPQRPPFTARVRPRGVFLQLFGF